MKRIFLILSFVFCILNSSFAQPAIQWQKCLGGTGSEEAYSIQQTSDGGYIVAGWTQSNDGDVTGGHGYYDYWIVKLDSSGNIQWQKCLGGAGLDRASFIQQTADGGYIVAGNTGSNDGDVTGKHGITDYWVVKLDSSGNLQWQKCLGGTDWDEANSVQQTADGGYIVAGYAKSNDGDVTDHHGFNNHDYWIVKLNSSGNIQWQKCLGGTSWDDANSVQQTADGGYIVAGFTMSNDGDVMGNHDTTGASPDYWIVKLDSSGNIQWQKCLGGIGSDDASSVQQTADGGYIVAGYTTSNDGDVTGSHGDYDCWMVKLDSNGSIQWQKCLGGTGSDIAFSVQQTADGGYIVAGYTTSNDGDVTGNHDTTGTYPDYWIAKLDSSGNIQWQKCLGGTGFDIARSIQQIADGGYIVAGGTGSINGDVTGNRGGEDYWIVKLYPYVLGMEQEMINSSFNLFPNPATNELTIENPEYSGLKIKGIEIYSSLGEKVFQPRTTNHKPQTIDVSQLPPGIYFITVTDQGGNKVTRKVVKM